LATSHKCQKEHRFAVNLSTLWALLATQFRQYGRHNAQTERSVRKEVLIHLLEVKGLFNPAAHVVVGSSCVDYGAAIAHLDQQFDCQTLEETRRRVK
jgi:hypothetical protein